MEPVGSLPLSQKPATDPSPELEEYNPKPLILYMCRYRL
jgi:hypothetical protein